MTIKLKNNSFYDTISNVRSKFQITNYIPSLRNNFFNTKRIKTEKLQNSREILNAYGGSFQNIQTSDGYAKLDTCLIKAKDFQSALKDKGCKFSKINGQNILILPEDEASRNKIMTDLKISPLRLKQREAPKTEMEQLRDQTLSFPFSLFLWGNKQKKEFYIPLRTHKNTPIASYKKNPTTVLFGGSAMSYEMNRTKIFELLLMGQDVFCCNTRGYGHSKGKPSEMGLYNDADSIHQYLTSMGCKEIIYWGYCQGAAPASHAASRYASKNIHFIGERCFDKKSDIFQQKIDKEVNITIGNMQSQINTTAKKIPYMGDYLGSTCSSILEYCKPAIKKTTSALLDPISPGYHNGDRAQLVKGSAMLIHGERDSMVNKKTTAIFRDKMKSSIPTNKLTIYEEPKLGHGGVLGDATYDQVCNHFESQNIARSFTPDDNYEYMPYP